MALLREVADHALGVGAFLGALRPGAERPPLPDAVPVLPPSIVVAELPLNGRNALALMMLTPGVRSIAGPTQSGFSDRGTNLSSTSINGGPSGLNAFMLDGNTNNNLSGNELGVNPSVDAVQEFKVITNSYAAEYGRTAAGVFTAVTKSVA